MQPIHTIDDLAFEFGRRALVRRWLAWQIDIVIIGLTAVALIRFTPFLQEPALALVSAALIWFSYDYFMESRWGFTPGKLSTGIRVVDAEGNPPGIGKAAIRTITRLFETNPILIGALPAAISIFTSSASQRIGDRMAGTYVLRKKDLDYFVEHRGEEGP